MEIETIMIFLLILLVILTLLLVFFMYGKIKKLENNINNAIEKSIEKTVPPIIKNTTNEIITMENERLKNDINQNISGQNKIILDVLNNNLSQMAKQVADLNIQNDKKLEDIRITMERRIQNLQDDNNIQLDKMRNTVDEKLQKTLEDKIGQSFRTVNERLEQVYKGLGEMQTLASGVGDLKKVLTNVKNRGILGEIQLRGILEEILPREQYEENIRVSPDSKSVVEFAIKLPGDDNGSVYLPIDAKFPGDAYNFLMDSIESGSKENIVLAKKNLETAIKNAAKDISTKYIQPPYTTDFAIMFLPFEGLYAEVVNMGLVETLQRNYKINIAGPTTMAALLNSLQMGFRTLAIQKHSSEVWNVLGAVKNEFTKFESVISATQNRLNQANVELEKLVGTRTRMINSKLRSVTMLNDSETKELLDGSEE